MYNKEQIGGLPVIERIFLCLRITLTVPFSLQVIG